MILHGVIVKIMRAQIHLVKIAIILEFSQQNFLL